MRNISWKLLAALGASVGFGADADTASGYKGIAWGTPCGEAVQQMEAKGFVFDRKDKIGVPGQARSPQESQLFLPKGGRASCASEESDLMLDTRKANPYVEIAAVSASAQDRRGGHAGAGGGRGGEDSPRRHMRWAELEVHGGPFPASCARR